MIKVILGCFLLVILAGIIFSCKDSSTNADPNSIVFPATNVSYGKQVQPLFNITCSLPQCHDADSYEANGYALDSYEHMMATVGIQIIVPKDPDHSLLYLTLVGKAPGAQMPLDKAPLNSNQVNGIKSWIAAGAPDN